MHEGRSAAFARIGCYLKSLSLEVIFSSRLEMWYEALAMLVLAVSLLLADCAPCWCVPAADWLACLRLPADRPSDLIVDVRCVAAAATAAAFLSFYNDCRIPEFAVFEWSSRSVCRGAGLAELDAAGSKVTV